LSLYLLSQGPIICVMLLVRVVTVNVSSFLLHKFELQNLFVIERHKRYYTPVFFVPATILNWLFTCIVALLVISVIRCYGSQYPPTIHVDSTDIMWTFVWPAVYFICVDYTKILCNVQFAFYRDFIKIMSYGFSTISFGKGWFYRENVDIWQRFIPIKYLLILQTLHVCVPLCDNMRSLFVQILLTFYDKSLAQILQTWYGDFRFSILQSFFLLPFL